MVLGAQIETLNLVEEESCRKHQKHAETTSIQMVDHCCLVPLNWMKGTFTGNHYVCWVKLWFLVYKCPGKNNLKCIHRFSKLSLVRRGAGLASRLLNFMEDKVRDWSQVRCAFLAFLMHFLWVFTKLYRYNSMYTRTRILFFVFKLFLFGCFQNRNGLPKFCTDLLVKVGQARAWGLRLIALHVHRDNWQLDEDSGGLRVQGLPWVVREQGTPKPHGEACFSLLN